MSTTTDEVTPNTLALRYATPETKAIWSQRSKVRRGRELWVMTLEEQIRLGMKVREGAVEAYRANIDNIDLASINARELVLKHDNLAEIEEFCALAGFEEIHKGFTTRDKTDTLEQLQILESLYLIRMRALATARRLGARAREWSTLDTAGRSHLVPAQAITLGKRMADWAEEMLHGIERLDDLIDRFAWRGIKGATGTRQDMKMVLGSREAVDELEKSLAREFGFGRTMVSVGQVYPRSFDFDVVSAVLQLAAGPANFALMIRLMTGFDLLAEGSGAGQKGSSAMPHKANARTAERITSFQKILRSKVTLAAENSGDQWLEGDVSCSAARRDLLENTFYAMDGLLEATMTILDTMEIFEGPIEVELRKYLPFLSSTRILMAAVEKGVGRETAHTAINKHMKTASKALRSSPPQDIIVSLLADEPILQLDREEIEGLMKDPDHGDSIEQALEVADMVDRFVASDPDAVAYTPRPLL